MHLGDGIIIFVIALILFGPKKLPEMARQVAKLMAEFRRASNEFKTQIDEELRSAEQADRQKAISAAAAETPAIADPVILPPSTGAPVSQHPYLDPAETERPDRSLNANDLAESPASEGLWQPHRMDGTTTDSAHSDSDWPIAPRSPGEQQPTTPQAETHHLNAGLNGLFAKQPVTFGAPYPPDAAANGDIANSAPDTTLAGHPAEGPPAALVEGTAAEEAQASIHHV